MTSVIRSWMIFSYLWCSGLCSSVGGVSLSYSETVFLAQARTDLMLGIPFIVVFALPVAGYLAPITALVAPRYVPSTFHTPEQVFTHLRQDARAARGVIGSLKQVY